MGFWLKSIKVTGSLQARKKITLIKNYLGEDLRVNMMTAIIKGLFMQTKGIRILIQKGDESFQFPDSRK